MDFLRNFAKDGKVVTQADIAGFFQGVKVSL